MYIPSDTCKNGHDLTKPNAFGISYNKRKGRKFPTRRCRVCLRKAVRKCINNRLKNGFCRCGRVIETGKQCNMCKRYFNRRHRYYRTKRKEQTEWKLKQSQKSVMKPTALTAPRLAITHK